MEYVVKNGVGYYEPKSVKLAVRVKEILADEVEYTRLVDNIKKINLKNGVADIAHYIVEEKLGVPIGI